MPAPGEKAPKSWGPTHVRVRVTCTQAEGEHRTGLWGFEGGNTGQGFGVEGGNTGQFGSLRAHSGEQGKADGEGSCRIPGTPGAQARHASIRPQHHQPGSPEGGLCYSQPEGWPMHACWACQQHEPLPSGSHEAYHAAAPASLHVVCHVHVARAASYRQSKGRPCYFQPKGGCPTASLREAVLLPA